MARDLVAELTEASHRFDSHNRVPVDCELLDRTIAEMKRLQSVEQRLVQVRDFKLPFGHPDWARAFDEASLAQTFLREDD
jgi:hypothetical protein